HHTEPGSWNCTIMARDSYNTDGQNSTLGTVDSYFGVGVPTATIDFGAYAHSQNSGTTDYSVLANNTGNVRIDFTLDAYSSSGVPADANAMSCTSGSLPVSAIRYATTSGVTATAKTALADAPTSVNVNLDQTPLGSTAYTGSTLYFGIVIPSGGQSGSCTGFLDIGATTP
ncbi:MAG TPA: hypothetical protein VK158_02495, partial [Acidobacteriota bacterium]|nr:hypothetical protein [Acidobacteriota bacterium]